MCCATGNELQPDFNNSKWQVGFSIDAGGIIKVDETSVVQSFCKDLSDYYLSTKINTLINANQLSLLQQLPQPQLQTIVKLTSYQDWVKVEQLLRKYTQYHLGYSIRSAELIDTYLKSISPLINNATI